MVKIHYRLGIECFQASEVFKNVIKIFPWKLSAI